MGQICPFVKSNMSQKQTTKEWRLKTITSGLGEDPSKRFREWMKDDILPLGTKLSVSDRIAYAILIGRQKIGVESLEAAVGKSFKQLRRYAGGEDVPFTVLEGLSLALEVPLSWIVSGVLSFEAPNNLPADQARTTLVSSYDPDADESGEGYSHETWKPRLQGARPEIDVRLGAGEGSVGQMLSIGSNGGMSGHRVVAEWVLPEAFLVGVMEANAGRTIVMEVVGDSMQPTYQPGDRVIVDLAQTKLVADTVYAISDGYSEPQIKRLQRVPFSQPARVRIISDNQALQTDEVELERVHIIGRICGVMARR